MHSLIDWKNVDWTKQNAQIAQELGISYSAVINRRHRLGLPRARLHKRRRSTDERIAKARAKWEQLKGLRPEEAEKVLGFRLHYRSAVCRLIRESNILLYQNQKRPWEKMNFDLPSHTLERIWQLPDRLANSHRCTKGLPAPKWTLHPGGLAAMKSKAQYKGYFEAVEAEKKKAAQFYAKT